MRAVNLLPEVKRERKPLLTNTSAAIAGAGLCAAAVAFLGVTYSHDHSRVADKNAALQSVQQQVLLAQAANTAGSAVAAGGPTRLAAFTSAASGRVAWDNLLDDVSRVLPAGTWLSSLKMQTGDLVAATTPAIATPGVPAAVPTAFVIAGVAFSQNLVAQVMQRLALVPALSDVTLQNSTRGDVGAKKAFQFTMSANVRAPEVPS